MDREIDASDLPPQLVDAIEAIIKSYRESGAAKPRQPRSVGWAKGVLPELPASFFEDLPPDVLDLFEGKAA